MSESPAGCCPPARETSSKSQSTSNQSIVAAETVRSEPILIPGGKALVGTKHEIIPFDGEGPVRSVKLKPFRIDATAVTNERFEAFVKETGFVTEAEKIGWSFVFHSHLADEEDSKGYVPEAPWWRRVDGAFWRDINGPNAPSVWDKDHPVVHVSWNDALAFADWAGGELPSEAQWEHAARGGLGDVTYPWGNDEPNDTDYFPCNIWQGDFPNENLCRDGFMATAPARSFEPNGYGLYNMCGNTWEWTKDRFKVRSLKKDAKAKQAAFKGFILLKGGSFLCHKSYCHRYRIAARSGNAPDGATTHMGFRLVYPSSHETPKKRA